MIHDNPGAPPATRRTADPAGTPGGRGSSFAARVFAPEDGEVLKSNPNVGRVIGPFGGPRGPPPLRRLEPQEGPHEAECGTPLGRQADRGQAGLREQLRASPAHEEA